MSVRRKIAIFFIFTSIIFLFIRTQPWYPTDVIFDELGGIPWLYALIGTIFGVICAFIIQHQWTNWSALSNIVQTEADALHELWLWSKHFPGSIHIHIETAILHYLDIVIDDCWNTEHTHDDEEEEQLLVSLNDILYEVFQQSPALFPTSFSLLTDILKYRARRIQLVADHMPRILRFLLWFSTTLMIVLAFFIGVHKVWLHYTFFISIASLVGLIYIIILDMDNPLDHGAWHLTPKAYEQLRLRIRKTHTAQSEKPSSTKN